MVAINGKMFKNCVKYFFCFYVIDILRMRKFAYRISLSFGFQDDRGLIFKEISVVKSHA